MTFNFWGFARLSQAGHLWAFRDNCGPRLTWVQVVGCFPSSEGHLISFCKAPLKGQAREAPILDFAGVCIFRQQIFIEMSSLTVRKRGHCLLSP